MRVLPGSGTAPEGTIPIPATLTEVSFIGREMEVFATTEAGEHLKAVSRPDPEVIGRTHGSPITFAAQRDDLIFFAPGETGSRI